MIEHWGREAPRIDSRGRSPPKDTKGRSPLKRRILGAKLTERNNARGEANLKEKEWRMKPQEWEMNPRKIKIFQNRMNQEASGVETNNMRSGNGVKPRE